MHLLPDTGLAIGGRPDTLVSRFLDRASRFPERVAYSLHPAGSLQALGRITWGDWATQARACAGAMLASRARRGDRVAIFARNRSLWPVAEMASSMCGLIVVGINAGASHSEVKAQISACSATVVIVDTIARLKTVQGIQAELSIAITVVCDDLDPLRSSAVEQVFSWDVWCANGVDALEQYGALRSELSNRIDAATAEDICTLFYDNGSSGGVIHTHGSMLRAAVLFCAEFGIVDSDVVLCDEPLALPFGRMFGSHALIVTGCTAPLIENETDCAAVARVLNPTVFVGSSQVLQAAPANSTARLFVHTGAQALCLRTLPQLTENRIPLASAFATTHQLCICVQSGTEFQFGSVGKPVSGTTVRTVANGELQVARNDCSAMGYWSGNGMPHSAISADDAWLSTGYLATVGMNGYVTLVGQTTELVTLASGVRVAVLPIESALQQSDLIEWAACHGEGRDNLVAVLSLNRHAVDAWAHGRGLHIPWSALVQTHELRAALASVIAEVNSHRFPHEHVKEFAVTDAEFSVDGGELTVHRELARAVIETQYRHVFSDLYEP